MCCILVDAKCILSHKLTSQISRYMQRVIAHLHDSGAGVGAMEEAMRALPLVPGMRGLLEALEANRGEGEAA